MWISNPSQPGFLSKLFSTHPPIGDRIKRLDVIGRTF
jgi:heat shock protein HtpX